MAHFKGIKIPSNFSQQNFVTTNSSPINKSQVGYWIFLKSSERLFDIDILLSESYSWKRAVNKQYQIPHCGATVFARQHCLIVEAPNVPLLKRSPLTIGTLPPQQQPLSFHGPRNLVPCSDRVRFQAPHRPMATVAVSAPLAGRDRARATGDHPNTPTVTFHFLSPLHLIIWT